MNNERVLNENTRVSYDPKTDEFTITIFPRFGNGPPKIVKLTHEFLNRVCDESKIVDHNAIW